MGRVRLRVLDLTARARRSRRDKGVGMDDARFDRLTRQLAAGRSRRSVLKGLAGGFGAGIAALLGGGSAAAKPKCRQAGRPCEGHQTCCAGLLCVADGDGSARRCAACPSGQIACGDGCVDACMPSDQCHDAGVCDPATGACVNPAKPDGAACVDGACCAGECVALGTPSNCAGCGDACADSERCTGAGCCPAERSCNERCCAAGETCVDPAASTCGADPTCPDGRPACGEVCCAADETCNAEGSACEADVPVSVCDALGCGNSSTCAPADARNPRGCFCSVTVEGVCACARGGLCVDASACKASSDCPPGSRCYNSPCSQGSVCLVDCDLSDDPLCSDDPDTCPAGQHCSGGFCVCDSNGAPPCEGEFCCPSGQHCAGGVCVCDATNSVPSCGGECCAGVCCNGECCPAGQQCYGDRGCVCQGSLAPPCGDICCPGGQTCSGGVCVCAEALCDGVCCAHAGLGSCCNGACCPAGQTCFNGACVCVETLETPCGDVCCPQGAVCSDGACICIGGIALCGGTQCCDPAVSFCCPVNDDISVCCPLTGAICEPGMGCFPT